MLKSAYAVIIALLLAAAPTLASASSPTYSLAGTDVKALAGAFETLKSEMQSSSALGLEETQVRIDRVGAAVQVAFLRRDASPLVVSMNTQSGVVQRRSTMSSIKPSSSIVLPGPDAKAIAVAYNSWLSGSVRFPYSRSDLLTGEFTARERADFTTNISSKGYYISYIPIHPKAVNSGLRCADFQNYVVIPGTWKVIPEPHIC